MNDDQSESSANEAPADDKSDDSGDKYYEFLRDRIDQDDPEIKCHFEKVAITNELEKAFEARDSNDAARDKAMESMGDKVGMSKIEKATEAMDRTGLSIELGDRIKKLQTELEKNKIRCTDRRR